MLNFPAKHTTDEDKNKQIHSQIKIHNEHFKDITKIEKYKKKTEHDPSVHYLYTLPKNQKSVKVYNKKKTKQNRQINTSSLKEDKVHTLVCKHLTKNHKKTVHHKLKDPPFFT